MLLKWVANDSFRRNSPLKASANQSTAGLTYIYPQTEMRDHPSVVGYLHLNYRSKSVTVYIPHYARLKSIPYTG